MHVCQAASGDMSCFTCTAVISSTAWYAIGQRPPPPATTGDECKASLQGKEAHTPSPTPFVKRTAKICSSESPTPQ